MESDVTGEGLTDEPHARACHLSPMASLRFDVMHSFLNESFAFPAHSHYVLQRRAVMAQRKLLAHFLWQRPPCLSFYMHRDVQVRSLPSKHLA